MSPQNEGRPTVFSSLHPTIDSEAKNAPGGLVLRTNAAAALNVGDVVYWSAAGEVNKSATAGNYTLFAGVVVGGERTDNRAVWDESYLGQAAAAEDEAVLVQYQGIARALSAAAIAAIGTIGVGTTAGRVLGNTTADQRIGVALHTTSAAAEPVLFLIQPR